MSARTEIELRLRLVTDRGDVCEHALGHLTLEPGTGMTPLAVSWPGDGPRVAIAMATHNPPLDLFAEQVASIVAQTHRTWICVVSDDGSSEAVLARMAPILGADPRSCSCAAPSGLGFYGNFERALQLVPPDATHVALSDQDDRWHADKLATLIGAIGDADLAYADARIVDRDGGVLSETFWVTAPQQLHLAAEPHGGQHRDGAASLFRASLLDKVLPFPERLGAAYHDHWIGSARSRRPASPMSTGRSTITCSMAATSSATSGIPTRRASRPTRARSSARSGHAARSATSCGRYWCRRRRTVNRSLRRKSSCRGSSCYAIPAPGPRCAACSSVSKPVAGGSGVARADPRRDREAADAQP